MATLAWAARRVGRACAPWGLALALAGCTGTRLGDQLSRSFSAPAGQPAASNPPAPTGSVPSPAAPSPAAPSPAAKTPAAVTPAAKPPQPVPAKPPQPSAGKPAPYRITIQLPAADPAAPAEAVTEALRAAGVSFEVEMIERVGLPRAATPTVTPAPAPR